MRDVKCRYIAASAVAEAALTKSTAATSASPMRTNIGTPELSLAYKGPSFPGDFRKKTRPWLQEKALKGITTPYDLAARNMRRKYMFSMEHSPFKPVSKLRLLAVGVCMRSC
jgi:hypothetical protein